MRRSICVGEDRFLMGRIARKYVRDAELRIDLGIGIGTQNGNAYQPGGTLALPTRG